jgi:hypothetical protein
LDSDGARGAAGAGRLAPPPLSSADPPIRADRDAARRGRQSRATPLGSDRRLRSPQTPARSAPADPRCADRDAARVVVRVGRHLSAQIVDCRSCRDISRDVPRRGSPSSGRGPATLILLPALRARSTSALGLRRRGPGRPLPGLASLFIGQLVVSPSIAIAVQGTRNPRAPLWRNMLQGTALL